MAAPFAVFFVLALLFGLLWLARHKGLAALSCRWAGLLPFKSRRGADRPTRQLRILERIPLSGQHSLHLVACGGRLLVVAVSPGGCQTLADYAESPASDARSAAGGTR